MELPIPVITAPLELLTIYTTSTHVYIVGRGPKVSQYHILTVLRDGGLGPQAPAFSEDSRAFKEEDLAARLKQLEAESTDFTEVCKAYGIIGIAQLLDGFYLYLITGRRAVASLFGHFIYVISKTMLLRLSVPSKKATPDETRYSTVLVSVIDKGGFFFSYGLELTSTFQKLACQQLESLETAKSNDLQHAERSQSEHTLESSSIQIADMFMWNLHLSRPLLAAGRSQLLDTTHWVLPITHGHISQRSVVLSSSRTLRLTLIGRRSRHFAGTRYLRRGVNPAGYVANEVETEQMITVEGGVGGGGLHEGCCCSVVQMRGSIPLFWSHTSVTDLRPSIKMGLGDSTYAATRKHFEQLFSRYGPYVCVLNLIRQQEGTPREMLLGEAFEKALDVLKRCRTFPDNPRSSADLKSPQIASGNGSPTSPNWFWKFLGGDAQSSNSNVGKSSRNVNSVPILQEPPASAADVREKEKLKAVTSVVSEIVVKDIDVGEEQGEAKPVEVDYLTYDMIANMGKGAPVFDALTTITEGVVESTGFFQWGSLKKDNSKTDSSTVKTQERAVIQQLQRGILRTNCIDCLDRTNVAQFCYGRVALARQLSSLGLTALEYSSTSSAVTEISAVLMDMYALHGDQLAHQYGGSGALHRVDERVSPSPTPMEDLKDKPFFSLDVSTSRRNSANPQNKSPTPAAAREYVLTGGAKNALVAINRYISNAVTDRDRQQAMDLFLGTFVPKAEQPSMWETRKKIEDLLSGLSSTATTAASPLVASRVASQLEAELEKADELEVKREELVSETEIYVTRKLSKHKHRTKLSSSGKPTFAHEAHTSAGLQSFAEIMQYEFNKVALDLSVALEEREEATGVIASNSSNIDDAGYVRSKDGVITEASTTEDAKGRELQSLYSRYVGLTVLLSSEGTLPYPDPYTENEAPTDTSKLSPPLQIPSDSIRGSVVSLQPAAGSSNQLSAPESASTTSPASVGFRDNIFPTSVGTASSTASPLPVITTNEYVSFTRLFSGIGVPILEGNMND